MVSKTNKLFFNIVNKKKLKIQLKQFLGPMTKSTKVVIVVLGDIGHSPRMCNHAYSFAQKKNVEVGIFGYLNSKPHEKIINNEKIRIHPLNQPPSILSSQFWPIRMLMLTIRFIFMLFSLFSVAKVCNKSLENSKKRIMLVQNPPGIPTMFACYLIAKLYKMLYVIDWHNYTFSLLRIPFLIEPLEGYLGRLSDLNICVSKTMQNDLKCRWGIEAAVFYDRPPNYLFKRNAEEEVNESFMEEFISDSSIKGAMLASNVLDSNDISGLIKLNDKSKRPFILVSSTSWTPDEDFSLLLNALKYYDNYCNENRHQSQFPKIFVIITGKGPEKEMYLEKIGRMEWTNVFIVTAWLKAENYPKLLSCADIGVCLHTSTSGFDLPMKIVDMFGCHLPVLAKNFKAISELVEDGTNGILFDTDEELSDAIIKLTKDFPQNEVLADMQNNLQNGISSWEENWEEVLVPLFDITN